MLLPQGDFARFLRAEPEDRGRLLRTLFDVGRFATVEDWLAGERVGGPRPARAVRHAMSTLLRRLAQVADVDIPEELAPELAGAGRGPRAARWVAESAGGGRGRLSRAAAGGRGGRRRATAEVDAEVAAARALADRHIRRDRARAELDALTAQEEELAPLRAAARRGPARRAAARRPGGGRPHRPGRGAGRRAPRTAAAALGGGRRRTGGRRPCWRATLRDEAAGLRALLPEVDRAAALRATGARLDRDGRRPRRALRDATRAAAPTGRPGSRSTRQLVAAAQEAAARLPGLQRPAGRPPGPRCGAAPRPPSGCEAALEAPARTAAASAGSAGSTPASAG